MRIFGQEKKIIQNILVTTFVHTRHDTYLKHTHTHTHTTLSHTPLSDTLTSTHKYTNMFKQCESLESRH
jgi:hypothetical protein